MHVLYKSDSPNLPNEIQPITKQGKQEKDECYRELRTQNHRAAGNTTG